MVQEKLQRILNSIYHHSINTAPFTLLFGIQMRGETDLRLSEIIEQEFQSQFNEERNHLRDKAKEQILKVQFENCRTYNLRPKISSFFVHYWKHYVPDSEIGDKQV